MKSTEHLLHNSTVEIKLQWIAIICMAIGLITSIYYHSKTLKAERIESEVNAFIHLNDRYQKLLFTLIHNDSEIFKRTDQESLQKNKYVIYELFELLATVYSLEGYFKELDKNIWASWKKRTEFLFTKPAIRYAWQSHAAYAEKIYRPEFVKLVESEIAQIDKQ